MKNKRLFWLAAVFSVGAFIAGSAAGIASSQRTGAVLTEEVKAMTEYYVSPDGSDFNDGTKNNPFKSLMGAFEGIKKAKDGISSDVTVYLGDGNYYVNDSNMLKIDGSYLPKNVHVTVCPLGNATPVLNGGMQVGGWKETSLNGRTVFYAELEKDLDGVYSLQVNGKNAELAKSIDGGFDGRNLSPQNANGAPFAEGSFAWDFIDKGNKAAGIRAENNLDILENIVSPAQTQAVWLIEWKEFLLNIDTIRNGRITGAYWKNITGEIDVSASAELYYPSAKHRFYLQNDVSLISEPGEFCYDKKSGMIYYYPREGESVSSLRAEIPLSPKIMELSTTVKKGFIENLTFKGLTFANTTVDYIDETGGFGIIQAQTYTVGAPTVSGEGAVSFARTEMDAAIELSYCRNVKFSDCTFKNIGLSAILFDVGAQNCSVEGCVFTDLGNCAVVVSNPQTHAVTGAGQVLGNRIENNVIRRVGRLNLSSPAILVYYTKDTAVMYNDIYDCPYTAISVGWGWASVRNSQAASNTVAFNRIGGYLKKLKDGGGVYTLGAQPGSLIEYNYFYSQYNNIAAIYLDEGTSGYTVRSNAVYTNDITDEEGNLLTADYAAGVPSMFWLNLNDMTGNAGTVDSPMFDISVVSNYYFMKNGFGKTASHPSNVIPPVLNEDLSNPGLNNKGFDSRESFLSDSEVSAIIRMAGVRDEYKELLNKV